MGVAGGSQVVAMAERLAALVNKTGRLFPRCVVLGTECMMIDACQHGVGGIQGLLDDRMVV